MSPALLRHCSRLLALPGFEYEVALQARHIFAFRLAPDWSDEVAGRDARLETRQRSISSLRAA
jgi:hypothetical protein